MKTGTHVCFRVRSETVSTFAAYVDYPPVVPMIARAVLDGTTVDCASNAINDRFLDTLKKRITILPVSSHAPQAGPVRKPEELNIAETLQHIASRNIVYNIPINFIHGYAIENPEYTSGAEMFDIHERLLFQMFNSWDIFDAELRVFMMGKVGVSRRASAGLRQHLLKIAQLTKHDLLLALFKYRGMYLRATNSQIHPCERTESTVLMTTAVPALHKNVITSQVKTPCPCARAYYLSRVYKEVLDTEDVAYIDEGDTHSADAQCKAYTRLLVTALSYMWEGIHTSVVPSIVRMPHTRNCRVLLHHHRPVSSVFAAVKHTADGGASVFEAVCNHAALCALIRKMVIVNKNYGSFCVSEQEGNFFTATFDNDIMPLYNPDDTCVIRHVEVLEQALSVANIEKRHAKTIASFIDATFTETAAMRDVGAKIKWVAFECIYQIMFNTTVALSGECLPTHANVERYNLTFGIITQKDETWIENNRKIRTFSAGMQKVVADIRALMLRELMAEETKREEKKAAIAAEKRKASIVQRHVPVPVPVQVPAPAPAPPPEPVTASANAIQFEQCLDDTDDDTESESEYEDFCVLDVDEIIQEFRCSPDDAIVTTLPTNQLPIGHGRIK